MQLAGFVPSEKAQSFFIGFLMKDAFTTIAFESRSFTGRTIALETTRAFLQIMRGASAVLVGKLFLLQLHQTHAERFLSRILITESWHCPFWHIYKAYNLPYLEHTELTLLSATDVWFGRCLSFWGRQCSSAADGMEMEGVKVGELNTCWMICNFLHL